MKNKLKSLIMKINGYWNTILLTIYGKKTKDYPKLDNKPKLSHSIYPPNWEKMSVKERLDYQMEYYKSQNIVFNNRG